MSRCQFRDGHPVAPCEQPIAAKVVLVGGRGSWTMTLCEAHTRLLTATMRYKGFSVTEEEVHQ